MDFFTHHNAFWDFSTLLCVSQGCPLVGTSHFVWTPTSLGHFGCLQVLSIVHRAATSIHVQHFVRTYVFIFFVSVLTYGISGSYVKCMFYFIRNWNSFPNDHVIWLPTSNEWALRLFHNEGRVFFLFFILMPANYCSKKWL